VVWTAAVCITITAVATRPATVGVYACVLPQTELNAAKGHVPISVPIFGPENVYGIRSGTVLQTCNTLHRPLQR
jgi:hypothetical protein